MILTTTPSVEGRPITAYHGIVVGEAIMGANIVRDFFASVTDVTGGRSGAYEPTLTDARDKVVPGAEGPATRSGLSPVAGHTLFIGSGE